ncbi:type IX secretion system sortase PorU [Parabacteroides sp. PF5-9]|uniref:type IX secretion system sortase PorU n=1 Tax=Parabacteroides sp. PF5-9 TaxID=1742404 RepID=UPI002472F3FB|nr:type IX secretion system sortase PorU [Parabacteroides sp. PF5-9]MDH6357573.1 hypothetical protein [Parabacteroides sp. PF5-9]
MKQLFYTLLLLFITGTLAWSNGNRYAANSVLDGGKWVKIRVDFTGIYKLSYQDLRDWGFSDPEKVSVHGYGGWPLDEDFRKEYVDDLPPVAVWRESDYMLFYAKGPIKWDLWSSNNDPDYKSFTHTVNPYSNYGYYFLTDSIPPKEMDTIESAGQSVQNITVFDDYDLHEKEWYSPNESGRDLFGESFATNLKQDFKFYIPGIVPNGNAKVSMRFISKATSTNGGSVSLYIDNERILRGSFPYSATTGNEVYTKATSVYPIEDWTGVKSENIVATVQYDQSGHQNVHLDFIILHTERVLKPYDAFTLFRSIPSIDKASQFIIQEANSNTLVFDVTDGVNPKVMQTTLSGSELSFTIPAGSLREFAIVQKDKSFPTPLKEGDVKNQNLHALPQTDMIIISSSEFKTQADRLAQIHEEKDGLSVKVVNPKEIYNEFSSGAPDASAYRRFMKMFYDRHTSEKDAPKYLLLFGDGVYDNRGVSNNSDIQSIFKQYGDQLLLTYQSVNSIDIGSYVTDDYFGFLDDSDIIMQSSTLDIGIGRLPVRTAEEARLVVDKLIGYMNNNVTGGWKNNVAFVADDGNQSDSFDTAHMYNADVLAEYVENNHPEFLVNKVYFDTYKKNNAGGHSSYPDVNSKVQQLLKNGLLTINYSGHGDTKSWAEERVMTETMIRDAQYTRLPLWITATCDFTRFDSPTTSAGEYVLLNKTSGGIGLFTTTRVVYRERNFIINQQLTRYLFSKNDNRRLTLGETIKEAKRAIGSDSNKLNFILIGDPAMKLAYPEYQMEVSAINNQPVGNDTVTFQALSKITVEGYIKDPDGNIATDFNGKINVTVLDSKDSITTLDNNSSKYGVFQYTTYPNTLFIGNESVKDGKFSFTFTVPKDNSYSGKSGKMSLYAEDESSGHEAQGKFLNYIVKGTDTNAEEDRDGPTVKAIYLNDTTFVSGGKVNPTPLFFARLWDKSGINITGSSIGHDMMLTIDNMPTRSYNLNSFYEITSDSDGEGLVQYSIPSLDPGIHEAEFIVWDVQNNSTKTTFSFEVLEGLKPYISEVYATPNPAREQVEFRLEHNRPESKITVEIMVYDITGRLQWKASETGSSELFKAYVVSWDLTNMNGSRLRPGVYLYRAAIRTKNSKEATKANKLIILAQ